ncbi:hypothetical protein DFJ73DRAFT_338748 [Zopfochytrium polystomum]|nr:hypothetical protein DFJ73DRAFT_338748 [Zopfochytrium polystomum]
MGGGRLAHGNPHNNYYYDKLIVAPPPSASSQSRGPAQAGGFPGNNVGENQPLHARLAQQPLENQQPPLSTSLQPPNPLQHQLSVDSIASSSSSFSTVSQSGSADVPPDSPGSKDAGKRKRTTKACDTCNKRKVKCDGALPACSQCFSHQLECTYSREAKKRGPKQGVPREPKKGNGAPSQSDQSAQFDGSGTEGPADAVRPRSQSKKAKLSSVSSSWNDVSTSAHAVDTVWQSMESVPSPSSILWPPNQQQQQQQYIQSPSTLQLPPHQQSQHQQIQNSLSQEKSFLSSFLGSPLMPNGPTSGLGLESALEFDSQFVNAIGIVGDQGFGSSFGGGGGDIAGVANGGIAGMAGMAGANSVGLFDGTGGDIFADADIWAIIDQDFEMQLSNAAGMVGGAVGSSSAAAGSGRNPTSNSIAEGLGAASDLGAITGGSGGGNLTSASANLSTSVFSSTNSELEAGAILPGLASGGATGQPPSSSSAKRRRSSSNAGGSGGKHRTAPLSLSDMPNPFGAGLPFDFTDVAAADAPFLEDSPPSNSEAATGVSVPSEPAQQKIRTSSSTAVAAMALDPPPPAAKHDTSNNSSPLTSLTYPAVTSKVRGTAPRPSDSPSSSSSSSASATPKVALTSVAFNPAFQTTPDQAVVTIPSLTSPITQADQSHAALMAVVSAHQAEEQMKHSARNPSTTSVQTTVATARRTSLSFPSSVTPSPQINSNSATLTPTPTPTTGPTLTVGTGDIPLDAIEELLDLYFLYANPTLAYIVHEEKFRCGGVVPPGWASEIEKSVSEGARWDGRGRRRKLRLQKQQQQRGQWGAAVGQDSGGTSYSTSSSTGFVDDNTAGNTGPSKQRRSAGSGGERSPLLVYSMCAIAARFSQHPAIAVNASQMYNAGDVFYSKARILVSKAIDIPSLDTIAALIMLVAYASGSGRASASWMYSGLAIRMAQSLKLDLDPDYPEIYLIFGPMTAHEKDLRRRLWWSCFIMDRYCASAADRSMLILERDVRVRCMFRPELWDASWPGLDGKGGFGVVPKASKTSKASDGLEGSRSASGHSSISSNDGEEDQSTPNPDSAALTRAPTLGGNSMDNSIVPFFATGETELYGTAVFGTPEWDDPSVNPPNLMRDYVVLAQLYGRVMEYTGSIRAQASAAVGPHPMLGYGNHSLPQGASSTSSSGRPGGAGISHSGVGGRPPAYPNPGSADEDDPILEAIEADLRTWIEALPERYRRPRPFCTAEVAAAEASARRRQRAVRRRRMWKASGADHSSPANGEGDLDTSSEPRGRSTGAGYGAGTMDEDDKNRESSTASPSMRRDGNNGDGVDGGDEDSDTDLRSGTTLLPIDPLGDSYPALPWQVAFIHLLFHTTLIMLHRPRMMAGLQAQLRPPSGAAGGAPQPPQPYRPTRSFLISLHSAISACNIISVVLDANPSFYWFTPFIAFCVFQTSLMHVVAAQTLGSGGSSGVDGSGGSSGGAEARRRVGVHLQALRRISKHWLQGVRLANLLEGLFQTVGGKAGGPGVGGGVGGAGGGGHGKGDGQGVSA